PGAVFTPQSMQHQLSGVSPSKFVGSQFTRCGVHSSLTLADLPSANLSVLIRISGALSLRGLLVANHSGAGLKHPPSFHFSPPFSFSLAAVAQHGVATQPPSAAQSIESG